MDAQLNNWDDLQYFLAVARAGTLSEAARTLGVNHSTVFRRIGGLESHLDARLFERLPHGYRLTAAGEELLAIAERVEEEVHTIDRRVLGLDRALRGSVRATTVDTVADLVTPLLLPFRDAYPGIEIDLAIEQRVVVLGRREADVAIRPGPAPTEPDVVARRIAGLKVAVYGSREYLRGRTRPRQCGDLTDYDLVVGDDELAHLPSLQWLIERAARARVVYRSNSFLNIVNAVKVGLGVSVLPCFMGDRDPALVKLFASDPAFDSELWLVVHSDLRQTARVRAFVDYLYEALIGLSDLLEGRHSPSRGDPATSPRRTS